VGAALLGAGGSLLSSIWSARRADTAHQREVRDLRSAGLNPVLSAQGRGAEVGEIRDPGQGAVSALAASRVRAEIDLLRAQAQQARSSARFAETQSNTMSTVTPGQMEATAASARAAEAQAQLAGANRKQVLAQLPSVIAKLKADIALTKSSGKAMEFQADINKFESQLRRALVEGRVNEEEIQEFIGRLPVWWRVLFRAILDLR